MALETVRRSAAARTAFLCLAASLAALAVFAVQASAQARGTGQEIFQDPTGDAGPGGGACSPCVPSLDQVRLGGTSDGANLNFWIATDTYCTAASPAPCGPEDVGTPHKAVSADYPSAAPQYMLKFQVGGNACYIVSPINNINSNAWTNLAVGATDCTPQSNSQNSVVTSTTNAFAEWVCNEARVRIPLSLIGNPTPGTAITMLAATTEAGTTFYDIMPAPSPPATTGVWQYILGQNGPDPNPSQLVAAYTAIPSPRVILNWEPPAGGAQVTGYKIERRMVYPLTTAWIQLASVGPSPAAGRYPAMGPYAPIAPATEIPTTYTDLPAPAPSGRYEYRVSALRCNNLGDPASMPMGGCPPPWSAACNALAPFPGSTPGTIYSSGMLAANVPFYQGGSVTDDVQVGAWPALKPKYTTIGPGERTNENDRFTACLDPTIGFFDLSTSPYLNLTEWTWNFGDGTPPVTVRRSDPGFTTQNVTHIYDQPGVYTVTLTVRDSQVIWPGFPLGNVVSVTDQVHSLGRPDCCPALKPVQSYGIDEGDSIAFGLESTDPDRKVVTANVANAPPPIPPFPPGSPNTGRIVTTVATFTARDLDRQVTGPNIPAGARIKAITDAFTAYISAPVTNNANGISVRIGPAWSYSLVASPDLPPHTFDTTTGTFKFQAGAGHAGIYTVQASVLQAEVPKPSPYTPACGETQAFVIAVGDVARAVDSDTDGIADFMDVCPTVADGAQADSDRDGLGDACDKTPCGAPGGALGACGTDAAPSPAFAYGKPDADRDGVPDAMDNCAAAPNNNQRDTDNDLYGDVCDLDLDGDGVLNTLDNCALAADRKQVDLDGDGVGDVCPSEGGIQGASEIEAAPGNSLAVGRDSNAQLARMGWGAVAFAVVAVGVLAIGMVLKKR